MRTVEQLTILITQAETALHEMQIGGQPVEVRDSDGSSVRYTPANAGRLESYIRKLKDELAALQGNPTSYKPIGITF